MTAKQLLPIVLLLCVCTRTAAQQITLSGKDLSLKDVISAVKKQTDYVFLYDRALLAKAKKMTVTAKNMRLGEFLDIVFKDQPFTYSFEDKTIILTPKPKPVEVIQPPVVAPPIRVKGKVVNEQGKPIEGVSIRIMGSDKGTVTDVEGNYSLLVNSETDVLVFSYIGLITKETTVEKNTEINITLSEKTSTLEDVVVVGYGIQKRLNVTGAVASVSSRQLKQSPVANISNALAGRLPGLITVQRGGEPGNDRADIWIRGFGTYNGAQGPLIMVDGVERSFDNIDPNEIDNITILKDASSTAVYGVRGANGVILVTTKRGTEKKPQISVTAQGGIQAPTRLPEYLDSYDALQLYREGLVNDGQNAAMYTDEYIAKFRDRSNPTYEYLYPNVSWQDAMLKDHSNMMQGNINVSGGNQFARYFVSTSYLRQDGLYKHEDAVNDYDIQAQMNRYNFRANTDLTITKNLNMELNLGGIIRDRNYPNVDAGTLWNRLKMTPPWWYPFTNPNGSISGFPSNDEPNPYGLLTQRGYRRYFETTLQATTGFTLQLPWITRGLSVRGRLSFDALNWRDVTRGKSFYSYRFTIPENETDLSKGNYVKVADGSNTLSYDVSANGNRKTLVELFVNYDRSFHDHSIKALGLYTQQSFIDAVGGGNGVAGLPYKYQGFVGRAAYAYKSRYFAEFNFGYNGSENFPAGKRFGFFPALSLGWIISNEDFFEKSLPVISLLKLRASAGEVGNDKTGQRFLYQGTWRLNGPGYTFGENYNGRGYGGAEETATGNINVTWERSKKYNLGLDLGVLNNTIKLETDVFYERRDQILTHPLTIPGFIGIANLPMINAGIVENKGFETVLELQKHYRDYGFFVRANYTFARNKIVELTEPKLEGREWQAQTGRRINEHYGLRAIGLFLDEHDIQSSPRQTYGAVQPGDIKYADLNGDGVIDSQDEGFLGRVKVPESIMGIAVGGNYKGFDVSVLFQGAFGAYVYYGANATYPFSRFSGILAEVKGNYFSAANPDVNALYPRMTSNDNANNYRISSFWHRNADYVRLRNAEMGYSFPKRMLSRIGFDYARVFVNAQNLITWSGIKTFDPEIPDGTGSYPQQKVINVGVNFTF